MSNLDRLNALNQAFGRVQGFTSSTFFKPDEKMCDWIIKQAQNEHGNQIIFDIGCGNGHTLRALKRRGYHRLVGVDPFSDYHEFQMKARNEFGEMIQFLNYGVESDAIQGMLSTLAQKEETKPLVILCRPCHGYSLVDPTIELCQRLGLELLYIGLRTNVDLDLGEYDYEIVEHEGTSEDNEIVIRIK